MSFPGFVKIIYFKKQVNSEQIIFPFPPCPVADDTEGPREKEEGEDEMARTPILPFEARRNYHQLQGWATLKLPALENFTSE